MKGLVAVVVLLISALGVHAQGNPPVFEFTERIDFERPEAWAMARSASLLLLTGGAPAGSWPAGSVDLGLELIQDPSLDAAERQVGFQGAKVEDFNRIPVIPRPRARVGLGAGLVLDAAYVPPLEIEGLEPHIVSLALERPLATFERWVVSARAYGQLARIEGDITCPDGVSSIPAGNPGNESGCEGTSMDVVRLDDYGLGVRGAFRPRGGQGWGVHFGVFATEMDLEFQVDALTFGIRDRTRMITRGSTITAQAGGFVPLTNRIRLAAEVAYTPLDVRRSPGSAQSDPLVHARSTFTFSF